MSFPMGAPGTSWWLLTHEIRMFYYDLGSGLAQRDKTGRVRRGLPFSSFAFGALAIALLHALAWIVMRTLPPLSATPSPALARVAGAALLVCFTLMLSIGLRASVTALFERGDLDLLLSSPLSSRAIFSVRLLAASVAVASLFFLLLSPVADVGLLLGQPRWLGIYPTVAALAVIAAALAMLATLALVRMIGVRKTCVAAQVLGALSGAAFFIAMQVSNPSLHTAGAGFASSLAPWFAAGAIMGPDSVLWLPGRALLGEPLSMLLLSVLALLAFVCTTGFAHTFFVRGVQQSGGMGGAVKRPARPLRLQFHSGLLRNTLLKEWRLIARDPQLISQILLQLLYLAPLYLLVVMHPQRQSLAMVGAALTFLAASLCASLTWLTVAAEDAPDLLAGSPIRPTLFRSAKVLAAFIPVALLLAPLLSWISLHHRWQGLLLALCVYCGAACAGLAMLWSSKPSKRGTFKVRARENWLGTLLESVNSLLWASLTYLSLLAVDQGTAPNGWFGWPLAGLILAGAMTFLLLTYCFRRQKI